MGGHGCEDQHDCLEECGMLLFAQIHSLEVVVVLATSETLGNMPETLASITK